MSEYKEYEEYVIKTVDDILNIPTVKLPQFMEDLYDWVLQRKILKEAIEIAIEEAKAAGIPEEETSVIGDGVMEFGDLIWKDDQKAGSRLAANIVNPDGTVLEKDVDIINTIRDPKDNGDDYE